MVKTSDFGKDVRGLQQTLYDADQILERACMITAGAPFFMRSGEYARIVIDGDEAELSWPEAHSGYYDSCSIENQCVSFPSALLLMSVDEIRVWKAAETAEYDAQQKAQRELEGRQRAEHQTAFELHALAVLKAKYEKPA